MNPLHGKTLFITGASRGIGLAIALRAARDGANIAIIAKTTDPNPKLPGTIHSAAAEIGCPSSSIRSGTSSPGLGAPPMSRRSRAGQTMRLTRSWRTRASHALGCIGWY